MFKFYKHCRTLSYFLLVLVLSGNLIDRKFNLDYYLNRSLVYDSYSVFNIVVIILLGYTSLLI